MFDKATKNPSYRHFFRESTQLPEEVLHFRYNRSSFPLKIRVYSDIIGYVMVSTRMKPGKRFPSRCFPREVSFYARLTITPSFSRANLAALYPNK